MRTEQLNVAKFHAAAGTKDPLVPTIPSLEVRILRAKLILEEAMETIHDGLGIRLRCGSCFTTTEVDALKGQWTGEGIHPGNLVKIADGCADSKYVLNGTALACGIDMEPVDDEVQRSNMSKFPHRLREDGKVLKNENYSPASLEPILASQPPISYPDPTSEEKGHSGAPGGNQEDFSPAFRGLLSYINETPELLSLLYDLDLMPEQCEPQTIDRNRMIVLVRWHQLKFTPQSSIETHGSIS